jgi:hypothetical protein
VLTARNKLYPRNVSGVDSVAAELSKYFYIISDKGKLSRWFYSSDDDKYYYENLADELTDISCITIGDYHFLGTKSGKLYAYSFVVAYDEEKDNYYYKYVKIFEKQAHAKTITSIIEHTFRRHYITVGDDGLIYVWKTPMNVSSFSSSAYVEAVPDEIFPVIELKTGKREVSALALSEDGTLLAGRGSAGVFFRCASGSAYYIFMLSAKKYYLAKYVKHDWKPLINWTSHSAVNEDAKNVVTIEFRGATLSGSVNSKPLFTVMDS